MRGLVCPAMLLLYKSFACEDFDGSKLLLPGYSAHADMKRLQRGDKIKVELADGRMLETTVQGTQLLTFDESMIMGLKLRIGPGFYMALKCPATLPRRALNWG